MRIHTVNVERRLLSVFAVLALLIHVSPNLAVEFDGGTGSRTNPYRIMTAAQLIGLGEDHNLYDRHFVLTADINLSGYILDKAVIAPDIGSNRGFQGVAFSGFLDGNGHVIRNLQINGKSYVGLFGQLSRRAIVLNLSLEVVAAHGTGESIGALAGRSFGDITSCCSFGTVTGGDWAVGGLVGDNSSGRIATSYSTCTVSGSSGVGGLVGDNGSGHITLSYSTGFVGGDKNVGGLVGFNDLDGSITSSYSTGPVSGDGWYVGGLVGNNGNRDGEGNIASSFWDTESSGRVSSDGGTPKSTAEMQDISTFLDAGWDFLGETANGTSNFWQIQAGNSPTLVVHSAEYVPKLNGAGTLEDPYLITNADDLGAIWHRPGDHYSLDSNIDLSGMTWVTAIIPWFSGSLDGKGNVISNLHIDGGSGLGLVGELASEAIIADIGLEALDVNGIGRDIGGLVGLNLYGSIISSRGNGSVKGDCAAGGLVGRNSGSITSSYSIATVRGTRDVGCLVGENDNGNVASSYSIGSVTGNTYVGGLVGSNSGSIASSYSTSEVTGNDAVGGLVGLVGSISGHITSSYSTGRVTGNDSVGGLVGYNRSRSGQPGFISNFWNSETSGQMISAGGVPKSTAEMQDIAIYRDAGWDFLNEAANGTSDIWQFQEGMYPSLNVISREIGPQLDGVGTRDNPYLLTDANELGAVWNRPVAHYRLGADIDLSGITWGAAVIPWFGGSLDGNDHVISNLRINGGHSLGLFGYLQSGAIISNLGLEAVDVTGVGSLIGALVGQNLGRIASTHSTGSVSGGWAVGGMVGENKGSITSSSGAGLVSGERNVGGLVGYLNYKARIASSYSTSSVSGERSVGGLAGYSYYGDITSSYSTSSVGGVSDVGGLVGHSLVGSITSSYSTGSVAGIEFVGGLLGYNGSTINGLVTLSFWDMESSGLLSSDGGVGLTSGEMMDPEMLGLNGFALDPIWILDAGRDYPRLAWEGTPGQTIPEPIIDWMTGSGTVEDPYEIDTVAQILRLSKASLLTDRYFVLRNDLDFSEIVWNQAVFPYFDGHFDGSGNVISHLTLEGQSHVGVFGRLGPNAEVTRLGLEAVHVKGAGRFIGGLAGYNFGLITMSYSTGSIRGESEALGVVRGNSSTVGGLVGRNAGDIALSYSSASVSGGSDVGGLVGDNRFFIGRIGITSSYSTGSVSGRRLRAGGLVGSNGGSITSSYSIGSVNGYSDVGGLVGDNGLSGRTGSSFWDIESSGQVISAGGEGQFTIEMQDINTYLDAGWDFIDESINGIEDTWTMLDYPELTWALPSDQN